MLLTKEVEAKWNYQNKGWYINKGYEFTGLGNKFICKVEDLSIGSHIRVECTCDYCGKIINPKYQDYYKRHYENEIIQNDCCTKCKTRKVEECNMIRYGVPNVFQLDGVKDKIKDSLLYKYGVDSPLRSTEILNKVKNTCIEKYGADNVSKNKDVIKKIRDVKVAKYGDDYGKITYEKYKETMLKKYGVENYFMTEDFSEKSKKTCLEKYGVENCQQNKDIKAKSMNTLSKNEKVNTSRQQKYLHKILGGELNYCDSTTGSYSLDIAFTKEKIYLEYNGGFHNAVVKLGDYSDKTFKKKEMDRYFLLKRNGWKMIKITSPSDWIPSDEVIFEEFNKALEWLKINESGHYHYNIDIGKYANDEKYGHLRKIKESDLK